MAEIIKLLDWRDMNRRTYDGRMTQRKLINKISQIVSILNTTSSSDNEISSFIEKSFSINGIIETYNGLGYDGWVHMVTQMVEHEIYERSGQV